ncbi:MAG: S8 family serine peptidase [Nitrospira sp.]
MGKSPLGFQVNPVHGSGATLQLDQSRLLISNRDFLQAAFTTTSFVDLMNVLEPSLKSLGLSFETPLDTGNDSTGTSARKISNTSWQFWVRSVTGADIDHNKVKALEGILHSTVNWTSTSFSPVYRFPQTRGGSRLFSPLSHLLVTKCHPDKTAELVHRLTPYQLQLAPISKYFPRGYSCFVLKNLQGPPVFDLPEVLLQKERPFIEDVWLDYVPADVPFASFNPTDPLYAENQWNLKSIQAAEGWNLTTPPTLGQNVTVAVIDFGCDLTHPDFIPNGYASSGTTFTYGIEGGDGSFEPGESHGTQCAGIIGARCNGKGIAGMAGQCQILPIRLGTSEPSALIAAIGYAVANHARVISMSIEPDPGYEVPVLKERIEETFAHDNVVLCAAAGNSDLPELFHPAAHPRVIACGASDQENERVKNNSARGVYWGSNYGTSSNPSSDPLSGGYLSVMAPGIKIPTTSNQGAGNWPTVGNDSRNYSLNFSGTSAATPQVAGLAALLISLNPFLTSQEVRNIMEQTADRVPNPGNYELDPSKPNGPWWQEMGYGRINVRKALERVVNG